MDIDVDWCLTCQRHTDGSNPYCSPKCKYHAVPPNMYCTCYDGDDDDDLVSRPEDEILFHDIDPLWNLSGHRWLDSGIAAWAAEIPPGEPIEPPSPSESHTQKRRLPLGAHRAPPKLLKSSHRIVPPSVCKTALPVHTSVSSPIATPPRDSSMDLLSRTSQDASLGKSSSKSGKSESIVSTPTSSQPVPILPPSRKPTIFGNMYTHARSWVSPPPEQQPPPVSQVDYSKLLTQLRRPFSSKKAFAFEASVRGRLPSELAHHDDHLSFKVRGRNSSHAAA